MGWNPISKIFYMFYTAINHKSTHIFTNPTFRFALICADLWFAPSFYTFYMFYTVKNLCVSAPLR